MPSNHLRLALAALLLCTWGTFSTARTPVQTARSSPTLRLTNVDKLPAMPAPPREGGDAPAAETPSSTTTPSSAATEPGCQPIESSCQPQVWGCNYPERTCAEPKETKLNCPKLAPPCPHDIEWRAISRPRATTACVDGYMVEEYTGDECTALDPRTMSFADQCALARSFGAFLVDTAEPEGQIGFAFFQPLVSNPGSISIPTVGTPFSATTPNVFTDVAFAPTFNAAATIASGPQIGTSGTAFSLIGNRTDTLTAGGTTATLTQNGTITTVIANIPEVRLKPIVPTKGYLGWQPWYVTIGTRYMTVSQDYHYTLTTPGQVQDFRSTQGYWGLGATVMLEHEWLVPHHKHWALYGKARGSFTQGQNHRNSTYLVTPTGGAATTTTADQTRSLIMPVGEFELGIRFNRNSAKRGDKQVEWMRAGAIFQIYGNAGPLSATSSNVSTFPNGNLYLVGGQISLVLK